MGVVYKARHEKLKRIVALKIITIDSQVAGYYLAHFQAEAEVVARLVHRDIVLAIQAIGRGETGNAGADYGDPHAALRMRRAE